MEVEADLGTEQIKEDPLFSLVDIVLLGALVVAGAWWLLKNKKKSESLSTATRSYTIQ